MVSFMKSKRSILAVVVALILVVGLMPTSALAASSESQTAQAISSYQLVLDKLNSEYGTDVHFATAAEASKFGISESFAGVSLEDFEKTIRAEIIANQEAEAKAIAESTRLQREAAVESGSGVCGTPQFDMSPTPKASYSVQRSKDVAGATVHLTATVNNNNGYWTYSSFTQVYTTYVAGQNTTPAFGASTYNYSFIDARRTCAISLYGYTMGSYGVIIDNNAYRYVEFWAGSGM